MNRYPIKTALAVAVAGFLGATGAMAQTSTTSPSTAYPSTMSPSTVSPSTQSDMKADERSAPIGTPSKTDSMSNTDSMSKSSQGKMAMPNHSETSAAAWAKLDANHRGYLMPEDVSQLKDFDFQAADKNHDGRIDATEFKDGWTSYGSGMGLK